MKRSIFLSTLFAIALSGCEQNEEAVSGYGNISLSLNAEKEISVAAATRVPEMIPAEELDEYLISVKQGGNVKLDNIKYSAMQTTDFIYPVANGYTVSALSATAEAANAANDQWGMARYGGESTPFAIELGKTTAVAVACSMLNNKVNVAYAPTFTAVFVPESYSVEIWDAGNETRRLTFDHNATHLTRSAYFEEGTTLNYQVKGMFKQAGGSAVEKTFNGTVAAAGRAKWYKLTITTTNGAIGLTFTIDKAVEEVNQDIEVNPYGKD